MAGLPADEHPHAAARPLQGRCTPSSSRMPHLEVNSRKQQLPVLYINGCPLLPTSTRRTPPLRFNSIRLTLTTHSKPLPQQIDSIGKRKVVRYRSPSKVPYPHFQRPSNRNQQLPPQATKKKSEWGGGNQNTKGGRNSSLTQHRDELLAGRAYQISPPRLKKKRTNS